MSEKHYCGDIGEVEYVRLKQPNMSSETYYTKEYVEKLQQRIAELEEQLKNTIKLPCKIDDIVYWVDWDNTIKYGKVFEITVHIDGIRVHTGTRYCLKASKIFLTYKEAEANLEKFKKETLAKLEELRGE